MALNWNAFLNDEQWNDPLQTTLASGLSDMQPSATRTSGSESTDLGGFDSLLSGTATDPLYGESIFNPNDYFLSDLEVLQPFGDMLADGGSTTESSPEPISAVTGSTLKSTSQTPGSPTNGREQSRQMSPLPKRSQRVQTFPNPTYESMFPNNLNSGFVEDVTFPDGPTIDINSSIQPSLESDLEANAITTTKRSKDTDRPDIISACWTSPLCPNHDQDGPPPNPSTCGSGCAPFLFANDNLPTPIANVLLPDPQEVTAEDGIVEIQPRPKKRSESQSSSEPTGRTFPSRTSNNKSNASQPKREASQESQEQDQEPTPPEDEDPKPKGRRRLPHNQVERKYRESLNTQLESLRKVVPALQQNPRVCDSADIEDLPMPSKPSKAIILASATAYIKQMEKDKKRVEEENLAMRAKIKQLQALVKCDSCDVLQYFMDLKIQQAK